MLLPPSSSKLVAVVAVLPARTCDPLQCRLLHLRKLLLPVRLELGHTLKRVVASETRQGAREERLGRAERLFVSMTFCTEKANIVKTPDAAMSPIAKQKAGCRKRQASSSTRTVSCLVAQLTSKRSGETHQ